MTSNKCVTGGFTREEINSLVLEYLIIEGFQEAAEQFSKDTSIPFNPDAYHMKDRVKIIEMVMKNEIENCISTINSSWPEFFDRNPDIYFQLRQLKMLEHIRSKEVMEALQFAQRYFADAVCKISDKNSKMLNELQKTMTLLAFDNPIESPNGYLLKRDFTKVVAGNLNMAILKYVSGDNYDSNSANERGDMDTDINKTTTSDDTNLSSNDPIPKLTQMMALMMHANIKHIDFPEDFYDNSSQM